MPGETSKGPYHCDNCSEGLRFVKNPEGEFRKDGAPRRRRGHWAHLEPSEKTCRDPRWHGNKYYLGPRHIERRKKPGIEGDEPRLTRQPRDKPKPTHRVATRSTAIPGVEL